MATNSPQQIIFKGDPSKVCLDDSSKSITYGVTCSVILGFNAFVSIYKVGVKKEVFNMIILIFSE